MPNDDRTARARLRDAAITLVGEAGVDALSARKVAERAGVSAGLVAHHFGSMDGLRRACNEHVAHVIADEKRATLSQGASLDPLAALHNSESAHLVSYLAAVLHDDSPVVAELVDMLVDDAEQYMAQAETDGHVRPTDDARRRAAVATLWSLGTLVLHRHATRLLGVDLTDPASADPADLTAMVATTYDLLGSGLFTPAYAESLQSSLSKELA